MQPARKTSPAVLVFHQRPRKASPEVCDRRLTQVKRWLDQRRTGPWIVQEAVRRWGLSRAAVQLYRRKARKQLGLLLPPKSLAEHIRRDGRTYSARVDAITFRRRVTLVMEWLDVEAALDRAAAKLPPLNPASQATPAD